MYKIVINGILTLEFNMLFLYNDAVKAITEAININSVKGYVNNELQYCFTRSIIDTTSTIEIGLVNEVHKNVVSNDVDELDIDHYNNDYE